MKLNEVKYLSLSATYEIDSTFDSEKFIKLRLRVCHDGTNPNNTSFLVEDLDKAQDSLKNIPILAHVVFDQDGKPQFGAHDMHIEEDKVNEDENRLIYDEQPIGVIPETNNYTIEDYKNRKYVYVDAYVWKDYSNYAEVIINRDKNINLSMEIYVDAYKYNSQTKIYNITDFRYKGITLLGNTFGTGMLEAKATTGSFSEDSKAKLFSLMTELQTEITKHYSSSEGNVNTTKEKEDKYLDEKLILLNKYNLKPEDLDFNIEEIDVTVLEEKIIEFTTKNAPANTYATYTEKRKAISNSLSDVYVRDDKGNIVEFTYFYLMDFDDKYAFVEVYHYSESCDYEISYGRFSYDFDAETVTAKLTSEVEKMYVVWLTQEEKNKVESEREKYVQLVTDFEAYKTKYSTSNDEVNILKEYKINREKEDRDVLQNELFEKFEKLNGNEEYEAIKENAQAYSITEIEEKCFAILGKATANFSVTKPKKLFKTRIAENNEPTEYCGGIIEKYSN